MSSYGMDHVQDGEDIPLPHITFTTDVPKTHHTLVCKQFPLAAAYTSTFNSSQGLMLDRVGIDLSRPIFTHGQLYTVLSRIRLREHTCIRMPTCETLTKNVIYHELIL